MPWNEALYLWLIHSAIVSLLVLAIGSVAVLSCRRPARRVWMIELILAGCLIAPWLGTIPGYPRLGIGWRAAASLPREEAGLPASTDGAESIVGPSVVPPSDDLPVLPRIVAPAPAAGTADAPSDTFDLASWIVAVYVVGVALGLGWWLVGSLGLVKIMRTTRPAPPLCRDLLTQIAGQGASRVRLLVSRRVRQPFAFALGRPVIVLPEDFCGDDRALRWSLAHEWAHIERHDFRAWLTAGFARVLFFYDPLVWWLRRQLRLSQDFLADDQAARQSPQREDYAEFLMASAAAGSLRPALAGLGMGSCKSELYKRVVVLVQNRPMESRVPRLWTVSVACAALVLVSAAAALSIAPQAAAQGQPTAMTPAATSITEPKEQQNRQSEANRSAPAKKVIGIVVNQAGRPVSDAHVWFPTYNPGYLLLHSQTNKEGCFTLDLRGGMPTGIIWAFASGYSLFAGGSQGALSAEDGGPGVRIVLRPPDHTEFLILTPDGKRLPGAFVRPYFFAYGTWSVGAVVSEEVSQAVGGTTGADGRVSLPVPRGDLRAVQVISKAHGNWMRNLPDETILGETTIQIQLPPVGRVEGRLIASDPKVVRGVSIDLSTWGSPSAGATLRLIRGRMFFNARPPQGYGNSAWARVVSDDEGRFIVPAIAEGRGMARVQTGKDSQFGAKPALFLVANPDPTRIEIRMMRTVRVEGVARAKGTGHPIAGVPLFADGKHITTDAQGKFATVVLPGDFYIESVPHPDGWKLSADGAGQTRLSSPSIGVGKSFSVPEGVKQFDIPSLEMTRSPEAARTISTGKDEPNRQADSPPDPQSTKKNKSRQPPVPRSTADAKTVRGKVIDESGKSVAGAEVWLPLSIRGIGHVQTSHAKSDAQGRFTLEVSPDWLGKMQPWDRGMTAWAYAAGHQLGMGKVLLPDGASDVLIRLGPSADTSFLVLDPEARPFAGALVEPFYMRTWQGVQFPPEELLGRVSARTDAEGRVKLPAAPPDLLYQVRVTSKDFGIQMQRTIEAPSRPIQLRPAGKIEGRLIADQPEIVRGVRLAFSSQEQHREGPTAWPAGLPTEGFADVKTDEQGRFVVPTIAIGDVRIDAFVNETQPLRPKLPASLSVQAGQTTSLEIPMVPTVVVRGSVRVKDTGKPVPGALIHIYYGVGRQGADPVSDAQGQYTARVLPGSIRLQVIAMPKGYAWLHGDAYPFPSYQVPEDAKEFDLPPVEFEPTKSVPGRVVDQKGQPVENVWISVVDGNQHYGRGKSDKNGQFEVVGVPVTINPANVKYVWLPEVGPGRPFVSTMPSECEILKTDPLTLRALPRDPKMDQP